MINIIFAEISEGGPSKQELLELLQYCDIIPASRVSSTFSSRAPSPSPSLMSIMYPSIKPGGRISIPASPLSTPVLNTTGRSKSQAAAAAVSSGHHSLENYFQPIGMSHSNSNVSLGENVVPEETDKLTVDDGDGDGTGGAGESDKNSALLIKKSELNLDSVQRGRAKWKQKSASVHIKDENKVDPEGSIHQRSRSNEIDYVSLRSDCGTVPSVSAFRSPPGSMQTFRLIGTSCHKESSGSTALQTSHTMVSPLDNKQQTSCSSLASDATVTTEEVKKEFQSEAGDGASVGGGGEISDTQSERYSWLKEFDSFLWSDYFTSDNNPRYSDC